MSKRRLAGFAAGLFFVLALAFLHMLEPVFGYTTPKWLFVLGVVIGTVTVHYFWRTSPE